MMSRRDEAEDSLKFDEESWKKLDDPHHKLEVAMKKLEAKWKETLLYMGQLVKELCSTYMFNSKKEKKTICPWIRFLRHLFVEKRILCWKKRG